MNFIIQLEEKNIVEEKSWTHNDNKIIYFYNEKIKINNLETAFSEKKLSPEKIRIDANEIFKFLNLLNSGRNTSNKISSVKIINKKNKLEKHEQMIHDYFLEGFCLSNYAFDKYKNQKKTKFKVEASFIDKDFEHCLNGTYISRDLVNEPLSHLTAKLLSKRIKEISKIAGFKVSVLNEKQIKSNKMGGVLAVNKGSVLEPTFNILTYKPKNRKNKNPIVLVGKGVMYDTGGLSLKPTQNSMDMMKCDMAGAASVIGAIYSIASAKSDQYVVGLIPAVENRPGGNAYVPGDVIEMMSGKTVEVLNTDAEGRMILADALHYAKRYKPELVIDIATLTGAAARSVGKYGAVAMEKNSYYSSQNMYRLWQSGLISGERIVPQPFWDEYKEELDSSIADIKNLGGPEAGHITAGKFLEHFTDYPWIHIDIAGVAFLLNDYIYRKKGATGFGSRLLAHFILNK